jgi:threonine dehydratase
MTYLDTNSPPTAPAGQVSMPALAPLQESEPAPQVGLAQIEAARKVLDGVIRVTPLEGSRPLSTLVGGPLHLKCENLQRTGSFKLRGAYVRIAGLSDDERARGVVAASAGNHAQGVALAASMLDTRSTVFMPGGAPIPKVAATRAYGAEARLVGTTVGDALRAANEFAAKTGAVLIHPFDHPDIVAGQGTIGLELLQQCPDVKTVVVSIGGGGLASGVSLAIKSLRPDVRVIGVSAKGAASFPESLRQGRPVPLDSVATMADGIAVSCPGELTLDLVRRYVDDVVTVSEDSLARALLLLLERAKLVVEPAGAASVAAIMDVPRRFEPPVVALLSGGNIDPVVLARIVRHGMIVAGRYLSFHLRIPDRPGELAQLLVELARLGANVLDVEHLRNGSKLHIDEVEVALQLETRGDQHCQAVLARLRECGYPLSVD